MTNIVQAIQKLSPTATFRLVGSEYEGIEWLSDDIAMPSKDAVNQQIGVLQAEYQAKQYQRDRATEYPSFADQFDTLYHGGYDAWKATIDSVKAKYPKP